MVQNAVRRNLSRKRLKRHRLVLRSAASIAVLALLMAGCSSGGSTNTGSTRPPTTNLPPPPPPPPTANSFRTGEYNQSWALNAIGAAEVYARGITGSGVTIGIVDFNFEFSSMEVNYRSASVGRNAQAVAWYEAQTRTTVNNDTHGHAVAVTAAGAKNDQGIHGVAFDATILAVDFFSLANETEQVFEGVTFHISDPWTYLTSRGARIINKSYGFDDGDVVTNPPVVTDVYVTDLPVNAVANGALLVESAGNNAGPNPILSNRQTVQNIVDRNLENGPGAYIIVGAVAQTPNGFEIASFSNKAGTLRDYFIVAPGVDVVFPWNGQLSTGSGTSFATPLVSGAAALVLEQWPQLTPREIADILFASATDLGAPGIDSIYGHGLLNVDAALQPIGTSTLAVASGSAPSLPSTGLVLGAAFGDAPALRAGLEQVTMLDGFKREFSVDLSGLIHTRPSTDLAGILRQKSGWHGAGYRLGAQASLAVHLYDDPVAALGSNNGPQVEQIPRGVLQFDGVQSGFAWTAGTGLYLSDVFSFRDRPDPFATVPLTRAFSSPFDATPGIFAASRVKIAEALDLSFGLARAANHGVDRHPLTPLRDSVAVHSANVRLDYTRNSSAFSLELGSLVEDGAILGSLAAGGFRVGERSLTMWTNFETEVTLTKNWSWKSALTLATTRATPVGGSLISTIGPILSSSSSFGLARQNLLAPGDALSLTLHQPLRVERAPTTLMVGNGRDPGTGAIILEQRAFSLVPSGREVALEAGYRTDLLSWSVQANLAYRIDAGHVADQNAATAMVWLARRF